MAPIKLLKLYYFFQRLILKITLKSDSETFARRLMGNKFSCQNKWSYLSAIKEVYIDKCDIFDDCAFNCSYIQETEPLCTSLPYCLTPDVTYTPDCDTLRVNVDPRCNGAKGQCVCELERHICKVKS